jgi:hypothetical protein
MSQSDLVRGLAEQPLLDHDPERVREMLVQRARLTVIAESRRELRDAVRQLMGNDIDGGREAGEDASIGVAVNHLPAVPERVLEGRAVVHGRVETQPLAVDGRTPKDLREKIVRRTAAAVSLVDFDVRPARLVLAHDELPGKAGGVLSGVDVASSFRGTGRCCCGGSFEKRGRATRGQLAHVLERGAGGAACFVRGVCGNPRQDVRRDDAADVLR